jgi:hypothetical protein
MEKIMTDKAVDTPLKGRVAQILNARELVINIGRAAGVKSGMKFAVLSETPMEIRDPESKEVLDVIDREKVRVEASEVRAKITICRTYRQKTIPGGPLYISTLTSLKNIAGVLGGGGTDLYKPPEATPETLKAEDASLPPALSPQESYVKINDRVVQVTE